MDISIRELKANPGAAIKRVQAGERVRITAHRKVVAELVAPGSPQADPGADGAGDALAVHRADPGQHCLDRCGQSAGMLGCNPFQSLGGRNDERLDEAQRNGGRSTNFGWDG